MFRKIVGGVLVAIVVLIGLAALAIPYYWVTWIWSLNWGTFLRSRMWIIDFLGLTLGTFFILLAVGGGTAVAAMAVWEWASGD